VVQRVRQAALGAYGHQELPFERLVELLQPGRGARRTPLFQVMFALQNAPVPAMEAPGLRLTLLAVDSGTSKFDLSLFAVETVEGLELVMEYSAELFEPATVDRMLVHYRVLLEGIVANPEQRIGAIPMLTDEEKNQMQASWDDSGYDEFATELDDGLDEDLNDPVQQGK
jgi:non-ribosomal peptide synthetase component F